MTVRVFAYGAAGALLGLVAPIVVCAILAVMLGGPSAPGSEATGADAVVAFAPLLALIGSVAGAALGIFRATRRRRPSRFVE
jgi:hypothetical protein